MSGFCLNCETALNTSYKHCPECGQKTALHRLSLHDLIHEAVHYFTHADKGIFQLLKALATKNGTVAREYVTGKRKKYFPPLNFFLLVGAIFVFAVNTVNIYKKPDSTNYQEIVGKISDPKKRTETEMIFQRKDKAIQFINKYANFVAMLATPLLTVVFFLFYFKAGYNYIEHLVAGMFLVGFCNFIYILLLSFLAVVISVNTNYYSLIFFLLFQVPYSTVFYYRFLNRNGKGAAFKAFGVSMLATILWVFISSGLIDLYIRNGFWGLLA